MGLTFLFVATTSNLAMVLKTVENETRSGHSGQFSSCDQGRRCFWDLYFKIMSRRKQRPKRATASENRMHTLQDEWFNLAFLQSGLFLFFL